MKWSRKGDLALGYGGIVAGIMISGFFFKIAMMVDDPLTIFVCVGLGCLFLIEIMISCMLLLGVYERDWSDKTKKI